MDIKNLKVFIAVIVMFIMRFSFDLKKRVFAQTLVVLLIGLALGFVFGQAVIPPIPVNQSLSWHVLQQVSDGSPTQISVDSNGNGIIDKAENANFATTATTATTANNANSLGGQPSSNYVRKDCIVLNNIIGSPAQTSYYFGSVERTDVVIPNNACGIGGVGYPPVCTLVMRTHDGSTGRDVALGYYIQVGNDWSVIPGGKIKNTNVVSANSGFNGDSTATTILRDSATTPRIYLYDDSDNQAAFPEASSTRLTLYDNDNTWAVTGITLCAW